MKFLLAAALAAVPAAAQVCSPSACAASRLGESTPYTCDQLLSNAQLEGYTCGMLEAELSCDCSGCPCITGVPAGGITDPPDEPHNTVEGGGPGGGGGGGGGEVDPPPTGVPAPPTAPPIRTEQPPPPIVTVDPAQTPPPDVDPGGQTGAPGVETANTISGPYSRTTTKPVTFTSPGTDFTHPPVEITTTTYISTSHRGFYTCEGSCAQPDFAGDTFCDDANNKCNCDWDGGDCCGTEMKYIYCTHCKCHDPNFEGIYNCPGDCANDNLYGDGYCDDENNLCMCNWDGGDCCGTQNHYGFCTECKCIDPTYYVDGKPTCHGNCGAKNYVGDGFCDDNNNNCGCDWDNGDCCGSDNSYAHCDDCFCIDPDDPNHLDPSHPIADCVATCYSQGFYGDGFCDDANNVCGCDWDGGDCCGGQNKYTHCDDCICQDPLYSWGYPPNCWGSGDCENTDWQGDAYCDDGNNNCGCSWDGGDCCGAEHFYAYCDTCACLDPAYIGEVVCSGKCEIAGYKGDGYCDDGNNVCGCDWDGGDCCDHNSKMTHCTDCLCLDPNYEESTCVTPCDMPNFVGDGHCDDANNVCGCDWDQGDCCGSSGEATQFAFCQECRCQDPNSTYFALPTDTCTGTCYHTSWVGDTHCDDQNNNCGCNWDGGDCCGDAPSYAYCTKCACLDPDSAFRNCLGTCARPAFVGDGYCDDNNNNCGCDWDNGDCCKAEVGASYNYCTACRCLDKGSDQYVPPLSTLPPHGVTPPPDLTVEQLTTRLFTPPPVPTDGGGGGITPPPDAHDNP